MEEVISRPILYNFYAEWCKSCEVVKDVTNKIHEVFNSKLDVINVDIETVADLREQYKIDSLPSLVLTRDGEELDRMVGYHSFGDLESRIKEHLSRVADESA